MPITPRSHLSPATTPLFRVMLPRNIAFGPAEFWRAQLYFSAHRHALPREHRAYARRTLDKPEESHGTPEGKIAIVTGAANGIAAGLLPIVSRPRAPHVDRRHRRRWPDTDAAADFCRW